MTSGFRKGIDAVLPHWTSMVNLDVLPKQVVPAKNACLQGDLGGCTEFAAFFEEGKYVERNMDIVSAIYQECCDKGEGSCCARKGEYYAKIPESALGVSCWWKHSTARELFEKGCEANDSRSCSALSDLLFSKACVRDKVGAKRALAKAITLSKANCFEQSKAHQCWTLGGFLFTAAKIEEKNEEELLRQARVAFDKGAEIFEERCKTSGRDCYFLGELLREKYTRATTWAKKPKPLTIEEAKKDVQLVTSEQVADLHRAKTAYEDGCLKHSNVDACTTLAQMHSAGTEVTPRDAELVMSYLARACRLSPLQCGLLGEFFAEYPHFQPPGSDGIDHALFQLACHAGNKPACHRAEKLISSKQMTYSRINIV